MKIGSLCTGYGGLDMAVEEFFDAETIWCAEIDKNASKLIDRHFNIPNHGDIKQINWSQMQAIDILTAGYPCQPFSNAGQRKGSNDERHIWLNIKEAIGILRPKFIVLENVRGHLTLGFTEVLADLTESGYDARWQIVRASDVGAPHRRERLFIVAYANGTRCERFIGQSNGFRQSGEIAPDSDSHACTQSRRADSSVQGSSSQIINRSNRKIHRFSFEMEREEIPNPMDQDKLNPKFVEYMMGLPKGWVTDLDIPRTQQLKMLGNGVVPQQAYFALEKLFACG